MIRDGTELIFESSGIELADKLSILHILEAVKNLKAMNSGQSSIVSMDESNLKSLLGLALKVKTRKH